VLKSNSLIFDNLDAPVHKKTSGKVYQSKWADSTTQWDITDWLQRSKQICRW